MKISRYALAAALVFAPAAAPAYVSVPKTDYLMHRDWYPDSEWLCREVNGSDEVRCEYIVPCDRDGSCPAPKSYGG